MFREWISKLLVQLYVVRTYIGQIKKSICISSYAENQLQPALTFAAIIFRTLSRYTSPIACTCKDDFRPMVCISSDAPIIG